MALSLRLPRRRPAGLSVLMTADAVGGVWRYAVDLGGTLAAQGIRVSLAVMGPAPRPPQVAEAAAAGLTICHRPYPLEWMDDPWPSMAAAGDWLLGLERSLHPDVIHLNGYAHAPLRWSAPVVVVAHSCVRSWWAAVKHESAPADWQRYTEAVTAGLQAATAIVAPSAAMLTAIVLEYGVLGGRAHVIPNGCAQLSALAPSMAPDRKQPVVLTAGRAWDEAKNIAALADVADGVPWPVYLAGQTISPAGVASRYGGLISLGEVSPREMAQWYARAAIFALPSRYEPFGLSILEAARAGCALVLGDIESLRENWNRAAVFVPPDDRSALQAALGSLVGDTVGRRRLAVAARTRAASLSIDRTAKGYADLYRSVAA